MSYVYVQNERNPPLYTVGFYKKNAVTGYVQFEPESDWDTKNQAAARVSYLNGGERFPK